MSGTRVVGRRARVVAVATWLAFVAACGWIVAHAHFTADLSAFLPTDPTPEQRLLIDQLREGPASHLILIAIDGGRDRVDAPTLARLSKDAAGRLRSDGRFLSVNDGESVDAAADRAYLFDHRYVLSDRTTPARFTPAGLHGALADTLDLLSSSAGLMLQSLVARDPTAEVLHLVDALAAGRALPTTDGVWVTHAPDGSLHALLVAETRAPGSDIDGQQVAIEALNAAFDAARAAAGGRAEDARLVMSGPPVFAVDARSTIEREARELSAIGLVLVATLLGFVYRSPRALVLGLVPMATGALAGLAAVELGFGKVHGIALGFGVTLIGEAVDYAIYLFVQRPTDDGRRAAGFWRTIALGVATSAIGFAALLVSGFQGLAQIGLLSIVGLAVAAIVTRFVLPAMLPARFAVRAMPRTGDALARGVDAAWRLRIVALVAVAGAAIVLLVHRDRLWSRELGSLSPMSDAVQAVDADLRSELGAPDVRDLVVVRADDRESALVASEAVVDALAPLVADGTLAGVEAPSRYLPSARAQRSRQAALPDDATLRRDFATALEGLPFNRVGFDGFFADVARQRAATPVDDRDLAGTSLGVALRALLGAQSEGGKTRWTAVVALRSASGVEVPRSRIAADLGRLDVGADSQVRLIDIKSETQNLYASYLSEALRMAGLGALGIVALLAVALRNAGRLARVVLPLAGAVVLVAAGHATLGGPLNLFHLIGLLLIVGVGSNYALFFDRRTHGGADAADDRTVLTSLVVANLTAVIGFGVLGLSSLPVLKSIGTTVAPGAFVALVLGAIAARRPRAA